MKITHFFQILVSLFILIFGFKKSEAQTVTSVVSTAGTQLKTGNLNYSYTIGETIIFSKHQKLQSGYHPSLVVSGNQTTLQKADVQINASLRPNPVQQTIYLDITNVNTVENYQIEIEINDIYGRTLFQKTETIDLKHKQLKLNCQLLNTGYYFLTIKNKDQNIIKQISFIKQK